MNQLLKLSLLASMVLSTNAFALSPVQGFYGGLMGEISHGPSSDTIVFTEDGMIFTGTVGFSSLSGGAGTYLGYKYKHFRAEGEFLYNRISTGPLKVGTCTIESPNVVTPSGDCPAGVYDNFQDDQLSFQGNSTAVYGLFNVYWDFFNEANNDYSIAPYLGAGIGIASVKNASELYSTVYGSSQGQSKIGSGAAAQGILGVNYFLDDFTWASIDYRLLATKVKLTPNTTNNTVTAVSTTIDNNVESTSYILNTINFTINFAFDKGGM